MLHIESDIGRSCIVKLPEVSVITKNYYRTKISYPIKVSTTTRSIYKVQFSDRELYSLYRYRNKSSLFKIEYSGDKSDLCKMDIKKKVVSDPIFMNVILNFMNGLQNYYHFKELNIPDDLIDPNIVKKDQRSKVCVNVTWWSSELLDNEETLNLSIFDL